MKLLLNIDDKERDYDFDFVFDFVTKLRMADYNIVRIEDDLGYTIEINDLQHLLHITDVVEGDVSIGKWTNGDYGITITPWDSYREEGESDD